jgi:hypothetical protein
VNAVGGRKNLIINGGFDVWQRGTTGTKSGSGYGGYLSVDRWASYYDGTILSQEATTIEGLPRYALRITSTGNSIYTYQKVEKGSSIVSGKTVTLSYWARSNSSRNLGLEYRFYDSAAETGETQINPPSVSLTTSWQKFTDTRIITDTSLNSTRDLYVLFYSPVTGSGDYVEIAQVQLEVGDQATEFEHRSYGEELALCQRYYEVYTSRVISFAADNVNGNPRVNGMFAVNKRGIPTIVATGGWTVNGSVNAYEGYHSTAGNYAIPSWTADAEL